jgi:uncharacterized protein YqgV (UPF0045/DUF77 family)
MNGFTTEDIMNIALDLLGKKDIPLDSGIHHPGRNIKKLIFTMDANVGLLHMAKQMGFDAVVCHHPCGVLLHQGEEYRKHLDILELHGVPRAKAIAAVSKTIDRIVAAIENKRFRMLYNESPNKTVLEVDAAKLLDLPFMNIHNLFDEMGRRILQDKLDKAAATIPDWRLADVLQIISELPEANFALNNYGISPKIFSGDPGSPAGKVAFVHGALSSPHPDIIRCYWDNGVNTVVVLHCESENLEKLESEETGNLIMTGHFLGDSIGMTPFIAALRNRNIEVVCTGGIIDAKGAGYL